MKNNKLAVISLFTIAIIATSSSVFASHLVKPPKERVPDGCSCVPDFRATECCDKHDRAYHHGGSKEQRKRADKLFRQCVRNEGYKILDDIFYIGVRMNAVPWLPTKYRWGFGYPFTKGHRGYTAHSKETEKLLDEQAASQRLKTTE